MPETKTPVELEAIAWTWLLSIKRLEGAGWRRWSHQVMVTMVPGELNTPTGGQPEVRLSIDLGGKGRLRRLRSSGNSLAQAAARFWRSYPGADLPDLPKDLYPFS